ncbi:MAG: LysM peptidoglycan-binding domain-containing protein [Urechidicola sp.]|nr:LysM peptidoglycan-binding domain-containing protein [Urechidicola sp.]
MKTLRIFFLLFFVSVLTSCAQQKKYISYAVQQGETMKSIAKDNGMKARDLMRLNPDVSKKPSVNTVIIIPNKNYGKEESDSSSSQKTHTVLRKENLFSISQKYGISVDALKKANDIHGNNISVGRVLVIPNIENIVSEKLTEVAIDSSFITHTVVKDDTLFSLTRRYQISEEALYEFNRALKDGLNLGMVLIVGEKTEDVVEVNIFEDIITDKPLNVLLMLPYKLNSIDINDQEFEWDNRLLNIVTDFHTGALIAIDSLRNRGAQINIDVVDTENSASKISSVLREKDVDDYDVVIGPLFLKNAKQVSKSTSTPVIAPIFSKTQTSVSDNNLVKVAPNKQELEDKVLDYLLKSYKGEKIIITGDSTVTTGAKISQIMAKLRTHDSINDITVLKPKDGYIKKERFIEVIDTVQYKNWVLLVGDNLLVTTDVVNNLGVMPLEKRDIQMFSFGMNSNFDNVSNTDLARLKFTFSKAAYIDVLSVEARSFEKLYKAKNHIRPSDFATKGFDVTYDTLLRLMDGSFNDGAKEGVSRRVASKFDYSKRMFGSTENKGVFLLQYQDNLELLQLD